MGGESGSTGYVSYYQEVGKREPPTPVIPLMRCFLSVLSAEACPIFYGVVSTVVLGKQDTVGPSP